MKRVLIVSGRYVVENPYREIGLFNSFQKRGFEAKIILPGKRLNAAGYEKSQKNDEAFKKYECVWTDSPNSLKKEIRNCDAVVLGSWKSYSLIANIAHSLDKTVFGYQSTSGFDHWYNDVDYAFINSSFMKRYMYHYNSKSTDSKVPHDTSLIVTGSIAHDRYKDVLVDMKMDRETFHQHYQLSPEKSTVVLFPKGIKVFEDKIDMLFSDWTIRDREDMKERYRNKYQEIINGVIEAECNLLIKMHPSAYASYRTRSEHEYQFWTQFPGIRILKPEDTYYCFEHLDFGLGINTHSALDLGYFGKPFIYVDSHEFQIPEILRINQLTELPPGPSSHWNKGGINEVNPWFPSWLGHYSKVEDLPTLLNNPGAKIINPVEQKNFIKEFWYSSDGKASDRIVDGVKKKLQETESFNREKVKTFRLSK